MRKLNLNEVMQVSGGQQCAEPSFWGFIAFKITGCISCETGPVC